MKIDKLRNIVENNDTKLGLLFDVFMQFLILLSIISFSIDTLPNLSPQFKELLNRAEVITVIIFTVEYILRLIVSQNKISFIFSFYGLIDLFAILPFYIMSGLDLRGIRIFRLFRFFRVFKLLRFNRAINRLLLSLKEVREELILFFIATIFILFIAATGIYYFENPAQPDVFTSIFHSLWWAVATLTTVGYGDAYPITPGGKFFTFVILIIGLGVVAIPSGLIASSLTKVMSSEKKEDKN